MGFMEEEQEAYLSVCRQHDYDLLTGKKKMTQEDYERITYITNTLGYSAYTQLLIEKHLDLACSEADLMDREIDILANYPDYYDDEQMIE